MNIFPEGFHPVSDPRELLLDDVDTKKMKESLEPSSVSA
jgi:hypothetical protein